MASLWHQISNVGAKHLSDIEEIKRLKLLNRVIALTIIVLSFYLVVELFLEIYEFIPFVLGMIGLVLIDFYFISVGKIEFGKHFASFLVMLCLSFFVLNIGDTFSEALFIPFVAAPLVIFKSKKIAYIYLILVLILLVVLKTAQQYYTPIIELSEQQFIIFKTMNVGISVIMTFILTFNFKLENEMHQLKLVEVNEIVSEKNKEIIDSINYAKKIQQAYMPDQDLFYKIFNNAFLLYKPKDIVSGDFYWFYSPEKRKILLAVADCTGHGVPGALMSVICCNALNEVAVSGNIQKPAEILNQTRNIVKRNLKSSDQSGQKDGMDISLCLLDFSDENNVQMEWSGANNPIWILQANTNDIREIKGNKQPIGFHAQEHDFTNHQIQLSKGDTIYLFSDGYSDQFGGENLPEGRMGGKKFKDKNLQAFLSQIKNENMNNQKELLIDKFDSWKGGLEQIDDVCIIGVRI